MNSRKQSRQAPSPAAPPERGKRRGLAQWLQLRLFPNSEPTPPPPGPEIRVPARLRAAVREEQAQRLARKLVARRVPLASLTLTDNRSVLLSTSRHGSRLKLRLHRAFVDADRDALEAAAAFAIGCGGEHRREALRRLRAHVDTWRQDNGKAAAPINPPEHRTEGAWHDLAAIRDTLNRRWFRSRVEPDITWGRWSSLRGRRRTIRLGSFDARENLIRVHPALDQSWVPRLFVEAVVHHEMLHAAMPAKESGGRRCLHGPEFRRRERELPAFVAAEKWLATNLHKLLRTRPRA
ncbi:MAG TPA: SprT-like domain-containing protein [Thermoanaerobaculia bacterium]|nr:SprT-like domain-containing protein [Thermoanaerobaculia bacterium]